MQSVRLLYKRYQRFIVLLGGFLLNISIGSFYTFSNISPYIMDYMNNCTGKSDTIEKGKVMWIFVVGIFGMGSSFTIGDYIGAKIGPSLTSLIAGWFLSINILLMKVTISTNVIVVILTYGLFNGIGSGVVYGVVMGSVCSWFPERRGTVTGILVGGFGLSALISYSVQRAYILRATNWMDNFPNSFVLLAGMLAVLQLIGAVLLKKKPNNEINDIDDTIATSLDVTDVMDTIIESDVKPHNLIFEVDFWILWITYSLMSAAIILNISFNKEFGYRYLANKYIEEVSLYGYMCSAIGGLLWGLIIDRFRYKVVMLILTISFAIFSATYYCLESLHKSNEAHNHMKNLIIQDNGELPFYYVWTLLLRLIPSGVFSIFPQISAEIFGKKHFIANYGMLFTAWSAGGLIAGSISYHIWISINYHKEYFLAVFLCDSFLAALAALVTLAFKGRIRNQRVRLN